MLRLVSQVHGQNQERPSELTVCPTKSFCIYRLSVEFFENCAVCFMKDLDLSVFCTCWAIFRSSCPKCSTQIVSRQAADNRPAVWLGPQVIVDTAERTCTEAPVYVKSPNSLKTRWGGHQQYIGHTPMLFRAKVPSLDRKTGTGETSLPGADCPARI